MRARFRQYCLTQIQRLNVPLLLVYVVIAYAYVATVYYVCQYKDACG